MKAKAAIAYASMNHVLTEEITVKPFSEEMIVTVSRLPGGNLGSLIMNPLTMSAIGTVVLVVLGAGLLFTKVSRVDGKAVDEYVKRHLKEGFSEEQIRREMTAAGIEKETAERVLRKMTGKGHKD